MAPRVAQRPRPSLKDKESREFWKAVRKAAKEVEKLPEWQRVRVGLTQEEQEAYDEYVRDGRRFSFWG